MKKVTLFYILFFVFSSCSSVYNAYQKSEFESKTKGGTLELANVEIEEYKEFKVINNNSKKIELKNSTENYLVRESKENYLTRTTIIQREKFNIAKIFDFVIPVIVDLIYLTQKESGEGFPPFVLSTVGAISLFTGSWKIYNKNYVLPELTPYKFKTDKEKNIVVDQIGIDVLPKNNTRVYYENFNSFEIGRELYSKNADVRIYNENTIFETNINQILVKTGYIDTTNNSFLSSHNTLYLKCQIIKIREIHIGNLERIQLTCTWSIYDGWKKSKLIEKELVTNSNYDFNNADNNDVNYLINALDISLNSLLTDAEVQSFLVKTEEKFLKTYNEWSIMEIKPLSHLTNNIEEVSKSVVTIITKEGHGSGTIISSDGYIISNYHVTGDNANNLKVVLENGQNYTCELIRSNPILDLSLLKIEGRNFNAFSIDTTYSARLGQEVYAIGTPNDIKFGQTITRGIISGKRNINDINYLQTDVSISPGNSGGALIDKSGNLIGIVNAKLIGYGVEGIGFVIPTHEIEKALKLKITKY